MNVTILPGTLKGAVTPPSSKSQTHRAVLALMLAQGEGKLSNLAVSQDIQATQDCVAALKSGQPAQADGLPLLDCGESGSTLRFLIPVALAVRGGGHFTGRGRLMERPQGPYIRLFEEKGISWNQEGACLTVAGQLEPGVYALPGNVSSQFITGLLYALPLLPGDSRIVLTTPLESRGYVDMTLDMLRRFDIKVEEQEDGFLVPGNQTYQARDLTLEADWSGAAFWYAANFLGAQVDIQGLNPDSVQGDRQIGTLYWKLARPGNVDIDLSQCPDLAPPLAVMAAVRKRTTRFVNAGRLRMKESQGSGGGGHPHSGGAGPPGGRYGGRLQRPPHCHDGRRGRCGLQRAGDHPGGRVREKILPPVLGGLHCVGRRNTWPHIWVNISTCLSLDSPIPRPLG